jgi:hypothetical protein
VKNAIFGGNVAELYNYPMEEFRKRRDHFADPRSMGNAMVWGVSRHTVPPTCLGCLKVNTRC